jgi:hypothetical protein
MITFFEKLFNNKPKNLPELIESHFEEDIKTALKKSDDFMVKTLLLKRQIETTNKNLKSIYCDVHFNLGYNKKEYEELVDSVCSKIIRKYWPSNLDQNNHNHPSDDEPSIWAV